MSGLLGPFSDHVALNNQRPAALNVGAVALVGPNSPWAVYQVINGVWKDVGTTSTLAPAGQIHTDFADASGTVAATVTVNQTRGKCTIGAGTSAVTVNNSQVTPTSTVLLTLDGADTTLTSVRLTSQAAGVFVVTGNASATANTAFSFAVIN